MTEPSVLSELSAGRMRARVYDTPTALGLAAARNTAEVVRRAVDETGTARIVVATGNSQLPFVHALAREKGVPWDAVTVFHLDEYVGIDAEHPASFQRWIATNVAGPLKPAVVHYLRPDPTDPTAEARRYEELLRAAPLDLVCLGIGENGHIAFNEPHQTDFQDPSWARIISLDDRSRQQQVDEGHFPDLDAVPDRAITLTVPALLAPRHIQVVVPERRKAEAVHATFTAPVSPACPATILRDQPHARLFLDQDSAARLPASPAR
jgi:glucosamine-6-phosphate deaminase